MFLFLPKCIWESESGDFWGGRCWWANRSSYSESFPRLLWLQLKNLAHLCHLVARGWWNTLWTGLHASQDTKTHTIYSHTYSHYRVSNHEPVFCPVSERKVKLILWTREAKGTTQMLICVHFYKCILFDQKCKLPVSKCLFRNVSNYTGVTLFFPFQPLTKCK